MTKSTSSVLKALFATSAAVAFMTVSTKADTLLDLDFTHSGGSLASGYTEVDGNVLAITPTATATVDGLTFTIDNVGVFDAGLATEPLTTSGFYTFGNGNSGNDHNFTLSGLTAGETVTLYAVSAWDGNGRGGFVTFGSSGAAGVQAQTLGDPGTAPTLANFTQIGTATVGTSGILTGTLNGAGGVYSTSNGTGTLDVDNQEGQVGAFVFDIQAAAVPEPSTYALIMGGGIALFALRRKFAKQA